MINDDYNKFLGFWDSFYSRDKENPPKQTPWDMEWKKIEPSKTQYIKPKEKKDIYELTEEDTASFERLLTRLKIMSLQKQLEAWKESAETTINFIKEHIRIIGEHEINGYAVVKEKYQKALDTEKKDTNNE